MAGAAKAAVAKKRHTDDHKTSHAGETTKPLGLATSPKSTKTSATNPSSSGKSTSSAKSPASEGSPKHSVHAFDGNRDSGDDGPRSAPMPMSALELRNLDLGMGAWATIRGSERTALPPRPKPSTLGQPTRVGLNTYNVTSLPTSKVYQYEVVIGNGVEKRGLVQKVWRSKELSKQLNANFIFDGNRLAWSSKPMDREVRCIVDLDAEAGRPTRSGGKENKHRVVVRQTNTINFNTLNAYLEGRADFDNKILEAINFLDHLLREYPSQRYSAIKRSFFYQDAAGRFDLGEGIEALKGVYQSMRIVHGGPTKAQLSINVDVANGTFWNSGSLTDLAVKTVGAREIGDIASAIRQSNQKPRYAEGLKRMRKLHVQARHRKGCTDDYVIAGFVFTSATNYKFEKDGKSISLVDYFKSQYGVTIKQPDLPLVQMTKGKNTLLPMELLEVKVNQRYPFKLNERQTQKMITFAVEPPNKRMEAIKKGLNMLTWQTDPVLKHFGMKINTNHTVVDSRLLPAPTVKFGQGEAKPGTSGRWDLRGKKFLTPNTTPLKSWAVCVIGGRRGGRPDKATVENFLREFVKTYQNHGGRVENKNPALTLAAGNDVGKWVEETWKAAGNQTGSIPQMLVFILPDKDSVTYGRIKRSCDCRYGVVSQCMQYGQVQKCNGQYMSNVCLKFNAKLGGVTCRSVGIKPIKELEEFKSKTLFIGADVSHAAPGSQMPSMAALTVSTDQLATRYAAVCQTNGFRNEMIASDIFQSDVKPLVQHWVKTVNGGKLPAYIMYLRDGVSEGQYEHVLKQEVYDLREMIKDLAGGARPPTQFIAVVAGKRHHVRFFPEQGKGDRNGNPLPGTLVETGVTHPFENDFYLCSHAAIKGTARPVHYHVILNEPRTTNEFLQTLLYEHCYQYIRATTPVSIHSAVYYAHIAAQRAIPHDPKWTGSTETPSSGQPKGKEPAPSQGRSGSSSGPPTQFDKLMPMPNNQGIQYGMWYI